MTLSAAALQTAVDFVRTRAPKFMGKIGVVASSGIAEFYTHLTATITIPYAEIPGVVASHVAGHASALVLGYYHDVPVICLQGRLHRYEGVPYSSIQLLMNLIKALGANIVIMTNVSGSLRAEVGPGELVAIHDHINFSVESPLAGPNDPKIGPRFLSMTHTYDLAVREQLKQIAQQQGTYLHDGVYIGVAGPQFETPAEIRMFRTWGADVIGSSTIPDVLFARHCGLRVAVVAAIVNLAAGMTSADLSHDHTLLEGAKCAHKMTHLILEYIQQLSAA